jgi:hypothetical protein
VGILSGFAQVKFSRNRKSSEQRFQRVGQSWCQVFSVPSAVDNAAYGRTERWIHFVALLAVGLLLHN